MTSATLGHSDGRVDCSGIDNQQLKSVLSVHASCFSADGAYLATIISGSNVYLWDARSSFHCRRKLSDSKTLLTTLCASPDGVYFAAGSHDGNVFVWQWSTLALRSAFSVAPGARIVSLAFFSGNCSLLAAAADNNVLSLCDVREGVVLIEHDLGEPTHHLVASTAVDNTSEGVVAVCVGRTIVQLLATGDADRTSTHQAKVTSFTFARDTTESSVVGTEDGGLTVRTPRASIQIQKAHNSAVTDLVSAPGDAVFVSASADSTAKVWSWEKVGTPLAVIAKHTSAICRISLHPTHELLVTSSHDGTAKLWKADGSFVASFRGHSAYIRGATMDPGGMYVATSAADNTCRVWPISQKHRLNVRLWSRGGRNSEGGAVVVRTPTTSPGRGFVSPSRTLGSGRNASTSPVMNRSAMLRAAQSSPGRERLSSNGGDVSPRASQRLETFTVVKHRSVTPTRQRDNGLVRSPVNSAQNSTASNSFQQQQQQQSASLPVSPPRRPESPSRLVRGRDIKVIGRTPTTVVLSTYEETRQPPHSSSGRTSPQQQHVFAEKAPQLISRPRRFESSEDATRGKEYNNPPQVQFTPPPRSSSSAHSHCSDSTDSYVDVSPVLPARRKEVVGTTATGARRENELSAAQHALRFVVPAAVSQQQQQQQQPPRNDSNDDVTYVVGGARRSPRRVLNTPSDSHHHSSPGQGSPVDRRRTGERVVATAVQLSTVQRSELIRGSILCSAHFNRLSHGIVFHQVNPDRQKPTVQGPEFRRSQPSFLAVLTRLLNHSSGGDNGDGRSGELSPMNVVSNATLLAAVAHYAESNPKIPRSVALFAFSLPTRLPNMAQECLREYGTPDAGKLSTDALLLIEHMEAAVKPFADYEGVCYRFCSSVLPPPSEGTVIGFPALTFATTDPQVVYSGLAAATGLSGTLIILWSRMTGRRVPTSAMWLSNDAAGSSSVLASNSSTAGETEDSDSERNSPSSDVVFPPSSRFAAVGGVAAARAAEAAFRIRPGTGCSVWALEEISSGGSSPPSLASV